jgi:hypothetical protein
MPRLTGPIIASAGGWFLRYAGGTPNKISFDEMQIQHDDVLLVAIPYPAGSTFKIWAQAPTWCNPGTPPYQSWNPICTHDYQVVSSVQAVRSSWGDAYYFDSGKGLLYLRLVESASFGYSFGTQGTLAQSKAFWTSSSTKNTYFSRGGLGLLSTGSYFWSVNVEASNCGGSGGHCGSPTVSVPAALNSAARLAGEEEVSTPTNSQSSEGPAVGPIVGGVVGGVVALILVVVAVAYLVFGAKKSHVDRV